MLVGTHWRYVPCPMGPVEVIPWPIGPHGGTLHACWDPSEVRPGMMGPIGGTLHDLPLPGRLFLRPLGLTGTATVCPSWAVDSHGGDGQHRAELVCPLALGAPSPGLTTPWLQGRALEM